MLCKTFIIHNILDFNVTQLNNLEMVFLLYEKEVQLLEEVKEPKYIKFLVELARNKEVIIFFMFKASVNAEDFLSIMVIDKGKILGVSDCLSRRDFSSSYNQRIYLTSLGAIGIVVDEDIYTCESVRSLFINGADLIIYMTFQYFNHYLGKVMYAHKVLNNIPLVTVCKDFMLLYGEKFIKKQIGKTLYIESFNKNNYKNKNITKFITPTFEW